MHSWFSKKLNEMIGLAHYCHLPLLQAHFVMTKKTVDDIYGLAETEIDPLADVLPMLIAHAEASQNHSAKVHLERALDALSAPVQTEGNIVRLDFQHTEANLPPNQCTCPTAKPKGSGQFL